MKQFNLTLRIWHPHLSAEQVVDAIGFDADIVQTVDQLRTTPKGSLVGRINNETFCAFRLVNRESGMFTDGLWSVLPKLESIAPTLRELHRTGGRSEIYVWMFPNDDKNLGFVLESGLMRALNDMGLRLSVEIYVD